MKQARIMLAAIAVFAVIGGSLAFKAKDFHTLYHLDAAGTTCNVQVDIKSTLNNPNAGTYSDVAGPAANCTFDLKAAQ